MHAVVSQIEVPRIILRCLEHMELKDVARAVAFLAKMTSHRPLAIQLLDAGLLDPSRMKRLLGGSCPGEVTLDVLMIISDLARMDKVIFSYIRMVLVVSRLETSCLNLYWRIIYPKKDKKNLCWNV